jgi:hypothetical protein
MIAEYTRRRAGFQNGEWITMADGQEWLFTNPPAPGVDAEYDGLVEGLLEAEDAAEARKFELAIAIFLLSRNYQPSPRDFEEIFCFGNNLAARDSAQEAISTLISSNLEPRRRRADNGWSSPGVHRPTGRAVPAFLSSYATHFRSKVAPWLN